MTALSTSAAHVLAGGGRMGELMRQLDWASTAVGPVESWPQSLRTALSILMDSRYPMYIAWGPEFVQFYNDGYRPILGSTKHPAALGRSTRETFAEIWDFIGPMFDAVMREGQPTFLEDQLLPMDRHGYVEECYFTFCYSAIRNEAGDVGGVFVTVTETTGRVIGERRLRTLRDLGARATLTREVSVAVQNMADVLDQNPQGLPFTAIYMVDDDGSTARLAAHTGLGAGHPALPDRVAMDDAGAAWPFASLRPGSGNASPIVVDGLAERFGGISSRVWPEPVRAAAIVPIPRSTQDGALQAILVVGISPRLAFDDQYRGFVSLVAGQIGTAVAAARAYEDERHRAQMLAELDRAKTAFFSNVSHEFRTPLTLMLGPLEDLLRAPADVVSPDARDTLQLLHRNGLRLLKLVNSLLDFARIEAGRVQASYEPVDLARVTEDLASAFRAAVERAGMRLEVECRVTDEPVYVDVSMWEKIVLNLLSNAFKFTFEGSIRVALEPVTNASGQGMARLTVSDTGVGIAPEDLPHVFERFRRVDGARSRTHEGSGIGLALVQELARLHGGDVRATSTVGQGTTFTVEIPLGTAHLPPDRIQGATAQASTALGAAPYVEEALRWLPDMDDAMAFTDPGHGEPALPATTHGGAQSDAGGMRWRVLVVDDNADLRAYLRRVLEPRYDVELAVDGADALERIRASKPDLVLSDVMMPRLDGFALVRALRADDATAAIPVILLTARAGEESTVEGLASGADDYLIKPFSARELLARMRAHLDYRQALRAERERLLRVFDQSPSFMAVLSGPDHVFEVANEAYLSIVGRDVMGKPVLEVLPELGEQAFGALLDDVYHRGVPHVGREARILLERSGDEREEIYVDFIYHPLTEPDGRITGVLAHGVDITAQVRARHDIERLYHSVREANEAKRQFLAAMSHELRTPLNAVIGYADLLTLGVRGQLTDEQRVDMDRIRSAAEYLLALINDILNFSRVEAGQLELRLSALSVSSVLQAAGALIQPHVEQQSIRLEMPPVPPDLAVHADAERLQQILLNLLMNATRHTEAGGCVRLYAEPHNGMVHVHVEDTGCGIPDEELQRIFEPFVQLDRTPSSDRQRGGGIGLGLAISRDLARRMGGEIQATSTVGEGSRFTVAMPAAPIA